MNQSRPSEPQEECPESYNRVRTLVPAFPLGMCHNRPIMDRWKNASGNRVNPGSILTATPNAVTSPIHDRMTGRLDPESNDVWLDPGMTAVEAVSDLVRPCDTLQM